VRTTIFFMAAIGLGASGAFAQDTATRIAELDRKLSTAQTQAEALQTSIAALAAELRELKAAPSEPTASSAPPPAPDDDSDAAFREQIVRADLGSDERGRELNVAPELFVQTRYQGLAMDDTSVADAPTNFDLSRMETRWSGRLSPKVGMGFELQYHPAPDGSAFELVNDAFVEYYPTDRLSVRVGQFVKPFGFDIQHSSSDRESPERGIFAGYFFPGQRDRGVMLQAEVATGLQLYLGAFNGNRFFADSNRRANVNARVRKVFERVGLATGVSIQLGEQLLPEGVTGNDHENLFGADVQWAWRRLGVRAEFVTGSRPSTLLDLEPEFAPAFTPGAKSTGGAVFSDLRLTDRDQVYGRFDAFYGDPVFGYDVRAFNMGYLRRVGSYSRIGVDYQFKNRVTANDDSLNSRLQVIFNVGK
jgi:Phosphate-selective porin O and P